MEKAEKKVGMKQCTKCGKLKGKSEFGKLAGELTYKCKECLRKYSRVRYRKNKSSVKKYYSPEQNHRVVDGVRQKRCRRCGKWKIESMYYKRGSSNDGLYVWCKECADKATNKCRRKQLLAVRN